MKNYSNHYFLVLANASDQVVQATWCTADDLVESYSRTKTDSALEAHCPGWSLKEVSPATDEYEAEYDYIPDGDSVPRRMTDEEVFEAYCAYQMETKNYTVEWYGPTHAELCRLVDDLERHPRWDEKRLLNDWMDLSDLARFDAESLQKFVTSLPLTPLRKNDQSTFLNDNFNFAFDECLQTLALDQGYRFDLDDLKNIIEDLLLDAKEEAPCK